MPDPLDTTKPAAEPFAAAPPQEEAQLIPPLRERHRRFVLEYVIDLNGSAAAVRAGYARGKAGGRASELLRRPEVQLAIREEMKERDKRLRLTSERIIREAMCIAFADPARIAHWGPDGVTLADSDDLAPDDRAAVKWISVGGRKGARAQRFEMHDKLAALEFLARMTGLLTRAPGRGRFALIEQDDAREKRDANAILRERLLKIARGAKPG
ncbi:MAG TPA: terminase small subunit [Stellaceae bacterium]|jgi:phage terminase small subunit